MKTKILLAGNQDAIIDDFFLHTVKSFICMTTSLRLDDIKSHLSFFKPDVIVYCIGKNISFDLGILRAIKELIKGTDTIIALFGPKPDLEIVEETEEEFADISLTKPINIKTIQTTIENKLEDRKIEREVAERKRQEELALAAKNARKHILIVDDDPVMLRTIKHYLEEEYVVATAPSGKFALKFLEQRHTDLVLLDYEMPELSGSEVFKMIRENEKTAKLPVVFLTGISDVQKIKVVLAMQPNAYLLKPVEYERLHKTITEILG